MASITITVPDAAVTRVQAAFDKAYAGRTDAGRTLNQWVMDNIRIYVKSVVKGYEADIAGDTARTTTIADVETLIG